MADERTRKLAALTAMCEMFGREMSDAGLAGYMKALDDVDADTFERAAWWCMRNRSRFPMPAEMREAVGAGTPSRDDRAIIAWGIAWQAVRDVGSYRSVEFADPVTGATIAEMGGWPAFCRPDQDEQWHRKTFIDTYKALAREGVEPRRLIGLHERSGGSDETVAIGTRGEQKRLTTSEETETPKPWGLNRRDATSVMSEIRQRARRDDDAPPA